MFQNVTIIVLVATSLLTAIPTQAKEVSYDLVIEKGEVNFTGKAVEGMLINGGIPGPTLKFKEGDSAVIHVRNAMDVPTSVHWHGLLVPPNQDGVPFISYPPIEPGTTFTYRFPIRQAGTYWYHSHTDLQEQKGVYGSIVIQPRKARHRVAHDRVVMLSDWTNADTKRVTRLLRRGSEAMGVRKGTSQSLLGAWKTGKVGAYWKREAMRMPPMDLADVAYDAFLINGQESSVLKAKRGETVRLRIINGGASTYFHLQYAGGGLKIVAADGQDVQSFVQTEPLLIGVAETYDVLVEVPENGSYEFRATSQDGSGHASMWIGSGDRKAAPMMPQPYVYDTMDMFSWRSVVARTPAGTMGMSDSKVRMGMFDQPGSNMKGMSGMNGKSKMGAMDMGGMDMGGMDHNSRSTRSMGAESHGDVKHNPPRWYDFLLREDAARFSMLASDNMKSKSRPFPPYSRLRSIKKTVFKGNSPVREVRLTLDGDMERYVWMLNNQPLAAENDIKINRGERVQFILINRTMMHHPMHLHGHFFRVLNGQGDYSPLKHTVNVAPMSTTVIEFEANEYGDWFFHCHLLYHMKSGMARVVRYNGFESDAETAAVSGDLYRGHWYLFGQADVLSNMTQGVVRYENLFNIFSLSWEAGWDGVTDTTWEGEFTYDRYFNRFTSVFAGVYAEGTDFESEAERLIAGVRYTLPLNVRMSAWIDDEAEARVTFDRGLMLTPRLGIFGEAQYDTRESWSYQGGLSYMIDENFSATCLWDSTYGVGAGLTIDF